MSIYLEFPAILQYPVYLHPFKNDEELFYPEEAELIAQEEKNTLQDYLTLRMI